MAFWGQQALRRATQESQPCTGVFRNPDSMSTARNVQLAGMTNFLEDLLPHLPEVDPGECHCGSVGFSNHANEKMNGIMVWAWMLC